MKHTAKRIHYLILLLALSGAIAACGKSSGPDTDELFSLSPTGHKAIAHERLELDSIVLDFGSFVPSLEGMAYINGGSLYYIDAKLGWVFVFDSLGKRPRRHLGIGNGPQEIPIDGVAFYAQTAKGDHYFIGGTADHHLVDSGFNRLKTEIIYSGGRGQGEAPNAALLTSYNPGYGSQLRILGDLAYYPLGSPTPFSDFGLHTDCYIEEGHLFARLNIRTMQWENGLIGRYSPSFAQRKEAHLYGYTVGYDFLSDGAELAVTYRPDSLIYVFDKDFSSPKRVFGYAGKGMDTNYIEIPPKEKMTSGNQFYYLLISEYENRGNYAHLDYVKERGLLFRGYRKSASALADGLQIYRADTLIADVEVPRYRGNTHLDRMNSFRVIGYISPYFYSNVFIDEEEETFTLYRFKLPE